MVHRLRSVDWGDRSAGIIRVMPYRVRRSGVPPSSWPRAACPRAENRRAHRVDAWRGFRVGREPHADRASLVEQVRQEQGECLESEPVPTLSGSRSGSDLVGNAHHGRGTRWPARRREGCPRARPEFDAVIGPFAEPQPAVGVVDRDVLAGDRPDGLADRLDGEPLSGPWTPSAAPLIPGPRRTGAGPRGPP